MTCSILIIFIDPAYMSSQLRSHVASSLIATDAAELNTCYTMYCCHTKVVKVSLPKLAGDVLKSAEEVTRIHLKDHTCAD